jgi:hypothetical protein
MIYYPPVTRVLSLTTIRRERVLPLEGQVLVQVGARVEPMSIVARADVPGHYYILDVAQALGVSPEVADKYIRPRPGQLVKAGQAVAGRRTGFGLFPRLLRAPRGGIVAAVGGGRILFESAGEPIEIRAYLSGRVVEVVPKFGAVIETIGALVQGVWGIGGESFGVLKILSEQPDQPLQAKAIDISCRGTVVIGGSTMDKEVFQPALEYQVRGIVVGGLDPDLLELAEQMPFPIVTTEGLGQAPMAHPIFQLLRTNEGREAVISGRTEPRWGAVRTEIVVLLPSGGAPLPPPPGKPLEVGVRVRVTRGAMLGTVGTVRNLPKQPIILETGAGVWGAVVAFGEGEERTVPIYNLELLG